MSSIDLLRSVLEEDPAVGTGEATQQNRRRAEAIRRESVPGTRGSLSTLNDVLNSPDPEPAPVRAQAIPAATETQQTRGEYRASEFAGDAGRKIGGSVVGGSLGVPQGVQEAAKGAFRRGLTGESRAVPFSRGVEAGMNWLMDATGFMSYADQKKQRDEVVATFDRLVSGAKIPGLEGLAEYGSRVQRDIESGISDEGKSRIEGSTPRGNILKGEFSFGDDPTLSGYALQVAGVLGSMAPTIATAVITRSPAAAAAVGGGQAANEGSNTAREYIGNLTDQQLTEVSPYYNTLIRTGMSAEEARQIVTDKAAETSAVLQGRVAAVGSKVTGKLVTGAYDDILRRVGKNTAGAAAAGTALGAAEEGVQELTEGIASDIGVRSQITDKEIGTNSAANLVLGALGGATVGGVSGARSTPASTLDSYLSGAIDSARSNPEAVAQQARMALDPNRGVALDPRANVRPADSQLGDVAITPGAASDQQPRTAVATQQDRPEDLRGGQPTGAQPVASAQQDGVPKPSSLQTLDQILNSSEESLLAQVDAQNQPPPVQPPAPNQSFVDAVESIKSDLGVDPGDTLSLTEVTDNTRLKRFKSALEGAFGVKVHFVNFGEQLTTGSGQQLGAFNGYRHNDTILVDAKDVDMINTTWHELTHVLETRHADVYSKLRDTLVPNLDPEIRQNLITALNQRRQAEVGRDLSQQELDSELVAYAVGDVMQNPESLGQMFDSFGDPATAKQFRDVVMEILDNLVKVIRGPQYIREQQALVKARKSVISAFAEYQKREAQKQMGAAPAAQPTAAPATAQVATPAMPTAPAASPQGAPPSTATQAPALTTAAQSVTIRFPTIEGVKAGAPVASAPSKQTAVGQQRTAVSLSGSENELAEQTQQPATTGSTTGENSGGQFMRPVDIKITGNFAGEMFLSAVRESPAEMTGLYIDAFGREINADLARELSPIYQQNPAAFASYVHEGASALVKLVFDQLLSTASKTDIVRFTAGGGGSGKGFALGTLNLVSDSTIIYDGTLSKLAAATTLINKATAAGLTTEVYYINADAKWSFGNALKRGTTKGRTVPLEAIAEAHFGAANVIRQLDGMYKGKILVRVINNTPAGAAYGTIDDVPRYNLDELKGWMYEELDRRVKDGYPLNLAAGFAPDKYSVEGRVGEPAERNDGAVRGEVRRGDAEPRRERVEQPEQPASPARADGRQEGVSQPSSAPETIPSGTESRQYARRNPLEGIVSPEEADARVNRRLKRKPGVGAPVNERLVLTAEGKPDLAVGKITIEDWIERSQSLLSEQELKESRTWYRQLNEALGPMFGDKASEYALAWLLSQKRASPTKGFTDVLRAADMAGGKKEVKKAGLNQQALIDVLSGKTPQGGIGAKLLDFIDSEIGKDTRTVVRDDVRGRQPAAIDVWAQRDTGFVDETVLEYVRKTYGEEAASSLQVDKTTSGEAQYEYGIDFYNDIVEQLNSTNFDGGGWAAREVQAVGWVTMQKAMGIQAEFVRDIIGKNTRRISIGLAPGANSVLSDKLAGKEISADVAQKEIAYLADLAGLRIKQNVAGVGAYLQWVEGAIQIDGVASPESVADFMDMVGYAFQQTEVINTRPLKSAKNMAVDVMSPKLDTVERATEFFSAFLEVSPKDKDGEPIAPGFQQITIDGTPGIRLLNFGGKWRQAQLQQMLEALNASADRLNIELSDVATTNVELNSTKNDWKENTNGENYLNSLKERGRVREAELIQRRYPPSRVDLAGDGTISWQRPAEDAEQELKPEPKSTGQFSRKLVELAANQAPGAPDLFGISETPTVLRAVGAPRQLFVIEGKTVAKVVNPAFTGRVSEEDGGVRRNAAGFVVSTARRIPLTVDEMYAVPRLIADPIAVIKSDGSKPGRRYGYKVIIGMVKDGFPVVAIVHPDVRYGENRASEIASVYPVNEPNSLAEMNRELSSSSLVYFDKGKALALAARIGRNFPSLAKITPTLAKAPNSVPNRTLPVIPSSNWMRKLEIGNSGAFSPNDPNTGFARRVPTPGNRFTLPARTRREQFVENLFENRMSRVEDIQQAVEQQGGTLDIADAQGNVLGNTDLSSAVQRMRGAVRGRLDRFKKEVEIPIIEDAAKAGVNLEEVAQYLYAMYAPERNAIIQNRNPTQFPTDNGSGMTNAEAMQIVASFRARRNFADIQRIASRVRNISVMTQNLLLSEGLVEPQVVAQWKADSPNYVPLRGFENFDEATGDPLGAGSFGRMDPRNPFARTAKGRETRAGQILENILKDYSDAVVLAEKNKVYRLLLQFVQTNPDPALWQVNAPKVSRSYYKGGMTPLGYVQGTVRIAFEVNEDPAQTIAVRVQGRPVFIRVQDEGMLEDLQLTGAIGSGEQAKLYFRVWSGVMQTLAKLRTTLSPAFVFIDAIRNTETGGFWNLVKYGPKVAGKAYARMFKSARVAWKAERDGTWQGNNDTITIREPGQQPRTITLKEAYDMFRADGGKVGYLDIKEIEDIQSEIQRMFRAAQVAGSLNPRTYGTQLVTMIGKVEDLMMDAAGSVEIAMRFATYMARLEAGATRQEATDAAKNVTVNFDRKGKWTPHLGLLYMFANANIQGTRATYNLIFKSGKAGLALGGALAALGYAVAQLGAGMSGDDDEPYWDKQLYKHTKIKSLLFFTPDGNTVTIPMAYGSGFFVNLGYALSDLHRGVPLAKVAAFVRDSFFTHFSPFGSLENAATFASPTLLDPFAVVNMNMTEQGIPLMPDSSFEPGKPDSEKFWAATRGTLFQQLSSYMNDRTGGTVWYSGGIDVSPETLRYGYGFLTGGVGGFARDVADSVYLTTEIGLDSAIDKNKIPIMRSFYQQNTGKQNQTEFFKNADEAVRAMKEASDLFYSEKGREEKTADRLRDQRAIADLGYAVQSTKQALAAHREEEIRIIDRRTSGSIDAATAEEALSRIAKEKDRLYTGFNREFYRANPKTPD